MLYGWWRTLDFAERILGAGAVVDHVAYRFATVCILPYYIVQFQMSQDYLREDTIPLPLFGEGDPKMDVTPLHI